jgi:hypothetical protein
MKKPMKKPMKNHWLEKIEDKKIDTTCQSIYAFPGVYQAGVDYAAQVDASAWNAVLKTSLPNLPDLECRVYITTPGSEWITDENGNILMDGEGQPTWRYVDQ